MVKREERKDRIPVSGARDVLTVKGKDPNYEYRWVLDNPGRLDRFRDGGWEVVTEDLTVGQKTVDQETKLGSAVTKTRGTATLVLMRIPKEWYDEDQMAKQDKVDALEASMQSDLKQGIIPGSSERGYGGSLNVVSKRHR